MTKKKETILEKDDFFKNFTYAQAVALSAILEKIGVPSEKWNEMAVLYAESFQKALKKLTKKYDGNGHSKES